MGEGRQSLVDGRTTSIGGTVTVKEVQDTMKEYLNKTDRFAARIGASMRKSRAESVGGGDRASMSRSIDSIKEKDLFVDPQ